MKKIIAPVWVITAVFFITAGLITHAQTRDSKKAQQYNIEGMKFYAAKDYSKAAVLFRKAIAADPNHKLANYNLACMYALLEQ